MGAAVGMGVGLMVDNLLLGIVLAAVLGFLAIPMMRADR
jgi:hypothetical protein